MITREMIENGFKTGKKGYRKDLSVMEYNRTDEEYINMLVTERYWKDIKRCFKKDADDSLKRIYYNGNWYQCRMADGGFCIGAKDICNPERLDLTEVKEYIQNATNSIYNASGLLEANNIKTLNKRLDNIKEELYRCYKRIDEIEESSYVNQKKNIKDKEIEEIER